MSLKRYSFCSVGECQPLGTPRILSRFEGVLSEVVSHSSTHKIKENRKRNRNSDNRSSLYSQNSINEIAQEVYGYQGDCDDVSPTTASPEPKCCSSARC